MSGDSIVYCLDCLCEIPSKRLAAVPNARYCITCQEQREYEGFTTLSVCPSAMAESELDGEVRAREMGWGALPPQVVFRSTPKEAS